jgi:D-alanine-D-alanine ligase
MSDRIVVLAGGLSHERDVSLRSGRRVADALRHAGCDVLEWDSDATLDARLKAEAPAVIFPLLHGAAGEDGSIRDLFELLGIPYVGSTPAACRAAFDKPVAKGILIENGARTPESLVLAQQTFREVGAATLLETVVERLGLPLMVKPTRGGSSLGATVVRDAAQLAQAMVSCFAYGDSALIERFVEGTEVAVSVIDLGSGPQALPPVEIVPDSGFYSYDARYTAGLTQFFTPARLPEATMAAAIDLALTAHRALGLRDISRTDMIIDRDGNAWFLEVNVAPGMTETSLLPMAAAAGGFDLGVLYRTLADVAISRS